MTTIPFEDQKKLFRILILLSVIPGYFIWQSLDVSWDTLNEIQASGDECVIKKVNFKIRHMERQLTRGDVTRAKASCEPLLRPDNDQRRAQM